MRREDSTSVRPETLDDSLVQRRDVSHQVQLQELLVEEHRLLRTYGGQREQRRERDVSNLGQLHSKDIMSRIESGERSQKSDKSVEANDN